MPKVVEKFQPDAIVMQCGADSIAGDPIGKFNLTLKGHGWVAGGSELSSFLHKILFSFDLSTSFIVSLNRHETTNVNNGTKYARSVPTRSCARSLIRVFVKCVSTATWCRWWRNSTFQLSIWEEAATTFRTFLNAGHTTPLSSPDSPWCGNTLQVITLAAWRLFLTSRRYA